MIFYSYSFVTSSLGENQHGKQECVTIRKWPFLDDLISLIDTIQILILPVILILIINFSILFKLINNLKQIEVKPKNRLMINLKKNFANLDINSNSMISDTDKVQRNLKTSNSKKILHLHIHRRKTTNRKAFFLLIIVTIFSVINSPLAIKKTLMYFETEQPYEIIKGYYENLNSTGEFNYLNLSYFIIEVKHNNQTFSINVKHNMTNIQSVQIGYKLASFLYYINFCINFLLYSFKKKKNICNYLN
jgi:hypothetical protein